MYNIIHRCFLLCVASDENDEMLVMLLPFFVSSKSRRVWKVLFQHVTHALSGFSRLSHKNVLFSHNREKEKEKKVSQASLD